jgi:hypothetical protein
MSEAVIRKPMNKIIAFILVVIIFAGLGPFFGTVVVFVTSNYAEFAKLLEGASAAQIFGGFSFVLFLGYLFGTAFAVVAGVFVAVAGIWFRWNNLLAPVAAALVSTLSGAAFVPLMFQMPVDASGFTWFFPACLAATFVCWLLTRRIVRRTWPSV